MELVSALLERGQFERWAVHARRLNTLHDKKEHIICTVLHKEKIDGSR